MRAHPAIVVPSGCEDPSEQPALRLADQAIGLWRAAEEMDDPALLEALRPLLTHIACMLARDIMEGDEDETPH